MPEEQIKLSMKEMIEILKKHFEIKEKVILETVGGIIGEKSFLIRKIKEGSTEQK